MGGAQSILQDRRPREICVIGAGVSGLRAAGLLGKAGFNVTILEARDRIGGRVQQTDRFGIPIDIGASWIHGTRGNPFVDLAKMEKVVTVACGPVDSICDGKGNWLSRDSARLLYEEVWDILEMAMERSREDSVNISDKATMMEFFRQEVGRRRAERERPGEYETLMMQIVEMWGAFMGNECGHQSLKNTWLDAGLEGDNLFMASTFKDILFGLLLPALGLAKDAIRFGCEVTRIANNSRTALVDIEAADGFRASFDDVIITVPLGWLKRNEDAFSPPLTPRISNAIHSLGYGNLDKVFIRFPGAFWDPGCGYHGSKAKENPDLPFPIESLFLRPEYAADTNPAQWRQEIISLSALPGLLSQPVIMFFVYGQWGRHITGLVRGMKQDSEEYFRTLDNIFRPYYSKLPNYDPAASYCRASEYLSTDWQNDKFAGYGSFTNLPVGSGDCAEHFDALREGMGENRGIWFAGEHTSPPGGLGTVTGAYWSGEEVARRVARRHGLEISLEN